MKLARKCRSVLELARERGSAAEASQPDNPAVDTIDRSIAVATTRVGASLSHLKTESTIQAMFVSRTREISGGPPATSELWTATTRPLIMLGRV